MNFDFLRHHDMDTVCDNLLRFMSDKRQQQITLNALRAIGVFSKEQAGSEFGALLFTGLIEKVGKDSYRVK